MAKSQRRGGDRWTEPMGDTDKKRGTERLKAGRGRESWMQKARETQGTSQPERQESRRKDSPPPPPTLPPGEAWVGGGGGCGEGGAGGARGSRGPS